MPEVTLPVVPGMEGCHWQFRKVQTSDYGKLFDLLLTGKPVGGVAVTIVAALALAGSQIFAAPDAQLIAGLVPGASAEAIADAIRGGSILDWAQYLPVHTGDTVLIRAGTIHALGPGLLIYEVQQTSDITYRVFDWNRPLLRGDCLHCPRSFLLAWLYHGNWRGSSRPRWRWGICS